MTLAATSEYSGTRRFERFVPKDILIVLTSLRDQGYSTVSEYNRWFKQNRPHIPYSSVTRWTRAWVAGEAHSETPDWHTRYREDASIIPDRFSAIRSGEFKEHYERWQRDGAIRYVNISCWHRPFNDPAVWNLARQIIHEFKPNVFPVLSDMLDSDIFSRHAPKPETSRIRILDEQVYNKHARNRYSELRWLIKTSIEDVLEVVPKSCSMLNLWGNHEHWILKNLLKNLELTQDPDIMEDTIDSIFQPMQDMGVLWLEADRRQWIPLVKDRFWVGHGTLARSGEGATARGYMNKLKYSVSAAVGHTHRQEELWTNTPTGERFYCVSGTLGPKLRGYMKTDWSSHNWGFQLIHHPTDSWKQASVEPIRIHYENGYYVTQWRGKQYSEQATVVYDDLLDFGIG